MTYYIQYCTPGSLTCGKVGDDLELMLKQIMREGCRITLGCIGKAMNWSKTAKNGEKHYIGCVCTIRKGEAQMTEYTSF